jgi:ribosomal protein L7/L12
MRLVSASTVLGSANGGAIGGNGASQLLGFCVGGFDVPALMCGREGVRRSWSRKPPGPKEQGTMDTELFDIVLLEPSLTPIRVYEFVRRFGGLNIKQAKKLVDSAPAAIITGMPQAQAEAVKIQLETVGAIVRLQLSVAAAR